MRRKELSLPVTETNCPDNDNPLHLEVLTAYGINVNHPRLTRLQLGRQALDSEELLEAADERLRDIARLTGNPTFGHPALAVTALQLCAEHDEPLVEIAGRSLRTDADWSPRWVSLDSPGCLHESETGVPYDTAFVPTYREDALHCRPREFVHFVSPETGSAGLQTVVHLARHEDGVGPVFFGVMGSESVYPGNGF